MVTGNYWSVYGDFKSKRIAKDFNLYENLETYLPLQITEGLNYRDIVLDHIDGVSNKVVFSDISNDEEYYTHILAIACLIEDRLGGSAIICGDFDRKQLEEAVGWANSILEKPVKLQLRMRYDELWQRLNKPKSGVVPIEDFYSVAYNCKEFTDFVRNHYSDSQILSYYRGKLAEHSHPKDEGAMKL